MGGVRSGVPTAGDLRRAVKTTEPGVVKTTEPGVAETLAAEDDVVDVQLALHPLPLIDDLPFICGGQRSHGQQQGTRYEKNTFHGYSSPNEVDERKEPIVPC